MLRITGKAFIASLLRYGVVPAGSGLKKEYFRQIGTKILDVLARKIFGVGQSLRLPIVHAAAGIVTVNNLYIQHRAEFMNLTPRAVGSSIRCRIYYSLCRAYGTTSWYPANLNLQIPPQLHP